MGLRDHSWMAKFTGGEFNVTALAYSPHELCEHFGDYIEHMKNNPINVATLIQKNGSVIQVPKQRPLSVLSFCLFIGVSSTTFYSYRNKPEYAPIIKVIEDYIYVNKYEGATVGIFNAAIIMRDLGLVDMVAHVLDEKVKTVNELFPSEEEIDAIVIEETTQESIKDINYE